MSSTKAVGVRIEIDVLEKIKQHEPSFVLSDFIRCALREYSEKLSRDAVNELNVRLCAFERAEWLKRNAGGFA